MVNVLLSNTAPPMEGKLKEAISNLRPGISRKLRMS
jgi:hypothetical protein